MSEQNRRPFGYMDAGEIIRDYQAAKDRRRQVEILADRNCCSKKRMAQWLADHGCKVDGRLLAWQKAIDKVLTDAGAGADPGEEPVEAETSEQITENDPTDQEPAQAPEPAEDQEHNTAPDTQTDDQAAKHDAGKPMLSLVPPEIIYAIARVRQYGCEKYHDPDNWRKVSIERYWDAVLRHVLKAWWSPEAVDDESGLLHIEHVACNLAFILEMMREEKENECNADR